MRKRIVEFMVAAGSTLWVSSAGATVDWHWSFQAQAIDLAKEDIAPVTVTNTALSTEEIHVGGISLFSFGDLGLLYEGDFKRIITPTILPAHLTLLPGESASFPAIQFHLNPADPPTPGIRYEIQPTLSVIAGNACGEDVSRPGCSSLSRQADSSFVVSYAPVPELPGHALLLLGLLTGALTRMFFRSQPAEHAIQMMASQFHHRCDSIAQIQTPSS